MTTLVLYCAVMRAAVLCVPVADMAACRAIPPSPATVESECSEAEFALDLPAPEVAPLPQPREAR